MSSSLCHYDCKVLVLTSLAREKCVFPECGDSFCVRDSCFIYYNLFSLDSVCMCVTMCSLTPSDIHASAKPDERSIMTYVSAYYHCFASSQKVSNGSSGWA